MTFPESCCAPVLDQELDPCLGAQPPVPVVAERRDHGLPHVGHLVQRNPGAEPLTEHGVGRQAAAYPDVEAGAVFGMVHADERNVVDLVHHVLQTGDRGLELPGQVRVLGLADVALHDLVDRRCPVDDLVHRVTGQRRPENDAGAVAARLGGLQADGVQASPDLGHVLHPNPVVLDVLAVREVRGVARELGRDAAQGTQRRGAQGTAIAADPQHEVLVLEHVGVVVTGPRAVVPGLALGIEAPPAETAAKVTLVDALEAALGIHVLDARPDVERVVVLLGLLVGVQRLPIAERPLALALGALGGLRLGFCLGHLVAPSWRSRRRLALVTGGCPAAQNRRPAEFRWTGLRRQGRQQQVHTRLKSTCRRTTSETRVIEVRAAVTPAHSATKGGGSSNRPILGLVMSKSRSGRLAG